ncbi:MAG: hypothetical protein GY771_02780 [bacterium]|nr:hypothetical protein [bacterium]
MYIDSDLQYVHIFITGPNIYDCMSYRLFGVRPGAINQVAMVEPGQSAFLMDNINGHLFGPYRISTPVLYFDNDTTIWKRDEDGRETFRFVIGLEPRNRFYRCRTRDLLGLCRTLSVRISHWDLAQRSAFTFLPKDGAAILGTFHEPLWRDVNLLTEYEEPVDVQDYSRVYPDSWARVVNREKTTEMLIEFALMKEQAAWEGCGAGVPVFNQMRVGERASRCDIITHREDTFYVIEMKSSRIKEPVLRELTTYKVWAQGNRGLLTRNFAPGVRSPYVMGGILGDGNILTHYPDVLLLGYAFENNRPRLTRYN